MPEEINTAQDTYIIDAIGRIARLEAGQEALVLKYHEFDKELAGLKVDLKYIREGLDTTKGGINKLLWGMATIFATYVIGFIIAGGLEIGAIP